MTVNHLLIPPYAPIPFSQRGCVGLAVESMKRHTTDEGWQLFQGLEHAGYALAGYKLSIDQTNVGRLLDIAKERFDGNLSTVVVQDEREWAWEGKNFREPLARFDNIQHLSKRHELFKCTILKDVQQRPEWHAESAAKMGCHAWIVYYHPPKVCQLNPHVRPQHLVRTWHTLEPADVPPFAHRGREGCLLSGAVSSAYPLRQSLVANQHHLPATTVMPHPGYHRDGCCTPAFLRELSKYKVAICTSSMYGYALRKIMEATAAGCVVVTDLPKEDMLPEIDGNLVRVGPNIAPFKMGVLLRRLYASYEPDKQAEWAWKAKKFYDWRTMGLRLAADIESLRLRYNS